MTDSGVSVVVDNAFTVTLETEFGPAIDVTVDVQNTLLVEVPAAQGIAGVPGGTTTSLEFPVASNLWQVNHGLNRYPSVTIVDSAGDRVNADVKYLDSNNLTVSFGSANTGKVLLN